MPIEEVGYLGDVAQNFLVTHLFRRHVLEEW